jgi:hypothetical protein
VKIRYVFALLIASVGMSGGLQSEAHAAEVTEGQREAFQLKMEELRARLALTPDQEAKIAPLVQQRNEKLKALRASADPDASRRERFGMMKEARTIQQDFVEQVEPMLSKEQKKEWETIREEMKEAAKQRRKNR